MLNQMKADTERILEIWGEPLSVKERIISYDTEGKVKIDKWDIVDTIVGDWQPITGSAIREEQGFEVKSTSQIIAAHDVNVKPGDRIYRADGTFERVNYVKRFEDHVTIRLVKVEEG